MNNRPICFTFQKSACYFVCDDFLLFAKYASQKQISFGIYVEEMRATQKEMQRQSFDCEFQNRDERRKVEFVNEFNCIPFTTR